MEAQVQEGLAVAFDVPVAAVRRAAMLMSSTTAAAAILLAGGLQALEAVGLEVGVGIQPMLAASAPGPDAAIDRSGLPALVDYKLDGIRVQVHRSGDEVRIFTRSLDDITARLPEVATVARALPHDSWCWTARSSRCAATGRPEAFQVVASRTMSSVDVAAQVRATPGLLLRPAARRRPGPAGRAAEGAARGMGQRSPEIYRAAKDLRDGGRGGGHLRRCGQTRLRRRRDQEPAGPVRGRPARLGLGQDQTAPHLRSDRHGCGMGARSPPGLAVQSPPRCP